MRHQKSGRTLGRRSAHRHALLSNLLAALVREERIRTTDSKAKELRRIAERTITWGTSLGALLTRDETKLSPDERARVVHHMRMARRALKEPSALHKLFSEIAPRYLGRPGGYTRIIKIGQRRGDAAPMSFIELLPEEGGKASASDKGKGKADKGKADKKEDMSKAKAGKAKAAEPAKGRSRSASSGKTTSGKSAGRSAGKKKTPAKDAGE